MNNLLELIKFIEVIKTYKNSFVYTFTLNTNNKQKIAKALQKLDKQGFTVPNPDKKGQDRGSLETDVRFS
jgi:predicted metal-binding protein